MTNKNDAKCRAMQWLREHPPLSKGPKNPKSASSVITDLLAALDEMQEVVEKLPHTADGVPVTPGMRYWFEYENDPGQWGNDLASQIEHEGVYPTTDFSMFFSTREAALAAQKGDSDGR